MHYQLYIPGGQTPDALTALGLADFLPGALGVPVDVGPDGGRGIVLSWDELHVSYLPAASTWTPAVPSGDKPAGRYWVGFWNDSPPTPDELKFSTILPGYFIPLGDGREWAIPAGGRLPKVWGLNREDGRSKWTVREQYRAYFERTKAFYPLLIAEGATDLPEGWEWYILDALRLNYRLLPEVAERLGIITEDCALQAVLATVEGQEIEAAETELKKSTDAATAPAG